MYEAFEDKSEELQQFEHDLEIWEASEKREIQERLDTHQVIEASAQIVEHMPEAELKMKLGETAVSPSFIFSSASGMCSTIWAEASMTWWVSRRS